jgi:hypothetical protein
MVARVPECEAKLWAHVGAGDGINCVRYSGCDFRKSGGWCLNEQYGHLNSCCERLAQLERDGKLLLSDCNCINVGPSCQMMRLVECLAANFIRLGGIRCPPVPSSLAMVADKPNSIEVRMVPLKFYHGGLWRLDGKWVIQLNSNDTPAKRRFFLFHEIFHILAHKETTPVFSRIGSEERIFNEGLADHFAASVLVPPRWVRREWPKFKDVAQMAAHFDAPYTAMFATLRRLGLVVLLLTLLTLLALYVP